MPVDLFVNILEHFPNSLFHVLKNAIAEPLWINKQYNLDSTPQLKAISPYKKSLCKQTFK